MNYNKEIIIKTKKGGYDGKGVWKTNKENLYELMEKYKMNEDNIFAEEFIEIKKELAILSYLSDEEEIINYPIVETIQNKWNMY